MIESCCGTVFGVTVMVRDVLLAEERHHPYQSKDNGFRR